MDISEFGQQNRLVTRCDQHDGTTIIPGRRGHIYEYSKTELGVVFIPDGENPRTRQWNSLRAKCKEAGMVLRQNGDAEGAFSFDAENLEHARLAIKVAGVKRKRRLTSEHRAKALGALLGSRDPRLEERNAS